MRNMRKKLLMRKQERRTEGESKNEQAYNQQEEKQAKDHTETKALAYGETAGSDFHRCPENHVALFGHPFWHAFGKQSQGVSFLNGLAQTLQSAKKTEQLVNTLVHTDESTGETTLRIPVADKQTVRNILGMIGKLFGQ